MAPRQTPRFDLYQREPQHAAITDFACTTSICIAPDNPPRSEVQLAREHRTAVDIGVHQAVGGNSDAPTPGDLLCGALACCLDSTIRIIADRLQVRFLSLGISVEGMVNVCGTLRIDPDTPVGFQRFDLHVAIEVESDADHSLVEQIVKAAEQSCVVLPEHNRGDPREHGIAAVVRRVALETLYFAGWGISLAATFMINHWHLFGLQQSFANDDPDAGTKVFTTPLFYRLVRHPIQTGVVIAMLATPDTTATRAILALGMLAYVATGLYFEERDLVAEFGETYRAYKKAVPGVLPLKLR